MCLIVYGFAADVALPAVQVVGQPRSETATQCRISHARTRTESVEALGSIGICTICHWKMSCAHAGWDCQHTFY